MSKYKDIVQELWDELDDNNMTRLVYAAVAARHDMTVEELSVLEDKVAGYCWMQSRRVA